MVVIGSQTGRDEYKAIHTTCFFDFFEAEIMMKHADMWGKYQNG